MLTNSTEFPPFRHLSSASVRIHTKETFYVPGAKSITYTRVNGYQSIFHHLKLMFGDEGSLGTLTRYFGTILATEHTHERTFPGNVCFAALSYVKLSNLRMPDVLSCLTLINWSPCISWREDSQPLKIKFIDSWLQWRGLDLVSWCTETYCCHAIGIK